MFRRIKNIFQPSVHRLPIKPIGRWFGFERGLPIDRYYVNQFLNQNRSDIKGNVVEISERTYTRCLASDTIKKSYVLNPDYRQRNLDSSQKYKCKVFQKDDHFSSAEIIDIKKADLVTGKNLPENIDCFICTQTLMYIFDLNSAINHSLKMLRSGGIMLITVPGISQICRYDFNRWGQYRFFTDLGLKKHIEQFVPSKNITTKTFGNVKTATAFLYGIAAKELTQKDLDYFDQDFPVTVTAKIIKP